MVNREAVLCYNRKAKFDYQIEETYEVGISLLGTEVKSLRMGGGSFTDSHVVQDGQGMVILNLRISPYKYSANGQYHDVLRNKRILLHKRQILKITHKMKQKGFSIVPIKLYTNKRNLIKVEIAVVKGKKIHNKKQAIKERDLALDAKREMMIDK